jgi:hypothetical protein
VSALSPRQMFLLDQACHPISEAFDDAECYLVGTAFHRGPYRDVDVRLIMANKRHDKLTKAIGTQGVTFLGLAIGQYLASLTGLPIDFQIQRQAEANALHDGPRSPLGHRTLASYKGDAQKSDADAVRAKTLEALQPELFKGLTEAQAAAGRIDLDGAGVHLGTLPSPSRGSTT